MKQKADPLQAALDRLILKTLRPGPTHGRDIARRTRQVSRGVLRVNHGRLCPALHRFKAQGGIASGWGAADDDRRAKFYGLTAAGRRRLAAESETWERFSEATGLPLQNT